MLRQCLHQRVQSADHTSLRRAGWDLGLSVFVLFGFVLGFFNGAVRTVLLVQIHKVSGTLKGQT